MSELRYLSSYSESVRTQVRTLIERDQLKSYITSKYPTLHSFQSDTSLYAFANTLKRDTMRHAAPLERVYYDGRLEVMAHALGQHQYIGRIQGNKQKRVNSIAIASLFKRAPEAFLRMILAHELAHFKEKDHNRAFYQLCCHIEPNYHQLEFDTRLLLIQRDIGGDPYA